MILDEQVLVSLSGSNIQYYESLGYNIPRVPVNGRKDRFTVKRGTKISVNIDDLQIGSNSQVNVSCDYCNKVFMRPYGFILKRRQGINKDACDDCRCKKAGESRKINFNDVVDAFSDRGYTLLTKEDEINCLNTDPLKYLCPIHGEKIVTWNNFNTKHSGCNECGVEMLREHPKKRAWERIKKMFSSSEYKLLSGFDEYTNSKDKCLKCLCDKHGEFYTSWDNFQRYCGCPICNTSIGERKVMHFLDENCIEYIPQQRFNDLIGVGGGKLSYDFYIPRYNILIEYQGAQHEKPGHFASSKDVANQNFITQQEHDKRKRNYAVDNGYNLLEIWYYDFNYIDDILSKYFTIQN